MLFTEGHMFLVMLGSLFEVGDISVASFFSVLHGVTPSSVVIRIGDSQRTKRDL